MMIKDMTEEERREYRHNAYLKRAEADKARQKEYYRVHRKEILKKKNNNYRIKCGLKAKEENDEV